MLKNFVYLNLCCLFALMLNVQVNNFSGMWGQFPFCLDWVLLKDSHTMNAVALQVLNLWPLDFNPTLFHQATVLLLIQLLTLKGAITTKVIRWKYCCLFVWFFMSQSTHFQLCREGSGWTSTKQGLMCLAQGHNSKTPVRLKPATLGLELSTLPQSHCIPWVHT